MIESLKVLEAQPQAVQSRILTFKELQEKSTMGRSFLYNEIAAGRIKPIKIGRAIRFVESEIDQWILNHIATR